MRETLKKLTDASPHTRGRTVTLCLQNKMIYLSGIWTWEVNSANIYACDVMFFPEDFEGTKGIIHPDDLPKLSACVTSLEEKELSHIEFRIITTYGEVKWIKGNRITVSSNIANEPEQLTFQEPWHHVLEQIAKQKELDFLTLQRELAEYTERLHGVGSWLMNKRTARAWYSDNMFRIHGLAPQSLNPHLNTFIAFTHPDDRQAVLESFEKAYEEELPLAIEYRIQLRSNEVRYVQQITRWVFNHKGETTLCGVIRDITEERLLLNELQSAHEQNLFGREVLKQFQQYSSAGYWYINLFTKKASYSENFYRIYGFRQVNVPVANSFLHLVHIDDRKRVEESFESMYAKKDMPEMEFRIVRPDGKLRYLKQSAALFTSADRDEWMIGTVQDITLQKGLEKKVGELTETAALHQLLNSMTEQTAEVSTITWMHGSAMQWSDGFYYLTGIKPGAEVSQKLLYGLIHPDDIKAFKKAEAAALNNEAVDPFDVRLISKSTIKNLRIDFRPLGERQMVVAIVHNLTSQKLLLQQQQHNTAFAAVLEDAVHDVIIFTNYDNTIIHWNINATEKTGISREDALYHNLFEVLPTLHNEAFRLKLSRALGGENITESRVENFYLAKAHDYTLLPLQHEGDKVTGVLHVVRDVSKQLELQQQLNERLAFIESLLEASVDQIVVLDRFMNYLYWNKKAEEYYSIPKEKVIGKNILEIFPSFRNHPNYSEFRKALKGETVYLPAIVNEQMVDYSETYLTPVKDQEKNVTAILWIVHDLSKDYEVQKEKQIAEEKIREQAHYLQRITETTPDMLSITELQTKKFTFLNPQTFREHGFDADAMSRDADQQNKLIVHADDRELIDQYFQKLAQASDDDIVSAEYRAKTDGGEWKWFLVRGKVFERDVHGKASHVLNAIENITARKNAEQEVLRLKDEVAQKASDKYYSIFNSIDDGLAIVEVIPDENGRVTDMIWLEANASIERNTGISGWIGKRATEMVPNLEQEWLDAMTSVYQTGEPVRMEAYIADLDRWISTFYGRIGGEGSRLITSVFRDITDRKQREQNQQFLITFSDVLRAEPDADAIANRAIQMLAEYLKLDRCYVGIALLADNRGIFPYQFGNEKVAPMPAEGVSLSDFPDALRTTFDETLVITDFQNKDGLTEKEKQNFAALGFGALVVANVRKEVRNPDWAINAVSAKPRQWTDAEVQLIEECTERTWAAIQRAKAEEALRLSAENFRIQLRKEIKESTEELKESKELLKSVFDASLHGIMVLQAVRNNGEIADFEILMHNTVTYKWNGRDLTGKKYAEEFPDIRKNGLFHSLKQVIETGEPVNVELYYGEDNFTNWFQVSAIRLHENQVVTTAEDVTERKKAEEELQKQLTLLKYTEYLAQSGTWEYEIASGDFKWSVGMYKLFALPQQMNLRPEIYLDFAIEEDRSVAKKILNHFKKTHDPFEEIMRISRNGEVRTLKIKASVIHDENGKPQKIIGVDVDITDVRKAEEKLKDTEHWLEQTTKASPDAITVYDVQQKQPVYLNSCLAEWIGVCNDELIAMGVEGRLKLIHPDDRLKLLQFNSKVVGDKNGNISTVEYRVNTIDGQTIWLRNRAKIFQRDNQGNVTHLLSILQNVTAEVELRNELKRRINFVETLLDSSINRMTVFDRNHKFIVWNKRCEEIFGITKDKVIGKTIFEMFPGFEKNPVFTDAHERSLSGGYVHVPSVYDAHTGTYLELFYIPLKNEGGETYAVLNIMHDVTQYVNTAEELNALNTQLEVKNVQLEQKNEEITSFAFVASHDMKEPLRKIHTFSDWLMEEEQDSLSEKGKAMIEKINRSVQRMEVLIEDILVLTKIHSDRNREVDVDLNVVIKQVLDDMADQVLMTQTTVDVDELPNITGNPNQVFYLFKNLMSNAIKFQKPGNVPHLKIYAEIVKGEATKIANPAGTYAKVSFADNGFGFDQRYAKKIFQVFQRLHGKNEYEGTGIGLAICKKIMENHNGIIDVKSESGQGSVFNCFFPLH